MIAQQSPVKDQASRGTCSIFSATALIESMLIVNGFMKPDVDMSEEWLQYLTTQSSPTEGSISPDNFKLLRDWGIASEANLPYGGEGWTSKASGLAAARCGHLPRGLKLRACLISHRDPDLLQMGDKELSNPNDVHYDPEFIHARQEALENRDRYLSKKSNKDGVVPTVSEIKSLLAAGIPLTLDIDFFYGAWNYENKKGIFTSKKAWQEGVITYPEKGSVDRGLRDSGGHSVVVVGYDDEVEVKYKVSMRDGSNKWFTRKGVYYIKNSWGTTDWGKNFTVGGRRFPGYGMILQDNAHEYGQFFHLDL
jgi:hypothetical protein